MFRTTIMIPETFKAKLEKEAEREKVSFGELVRRVLQRYLLTKGGATAHDPFLSSRTVFQDEGPGDVAKEHDLYLSHPDVHGRPQKN